MKNRDLILDVLRRQGKANALNLRQSATGMDGTEVIAREQDVPDFIPGRDYSSWPVGAPVADGGQVWQLLQPYNSGEHPGRPAELRALWSLCHTKDQSRAKPYVEPLGTSGMYMAGECYRADDGTVYRCLTDNMVYDAAALPGSWEAVI